MPLPDEPVEAVDREAGATTTPQARMIVRARSTSPPSRWTWRVAGVDPRDRAGDEDLGAEPARLLQRAAGELVAGHAGREAEVVLDPRRGAGLAAGRLALDHDRAQALRRAVHRRRPGPPARRRRSRCRTRRRPARSARPSSSATRRSCGRTTVLPSTTRIAGQSPSAGSGPPHCSRGVRGVGLQPPERDLVAVEEAAQLRAGRVPAVADARSRAAAGGSAARPCRPRGPPIRLRASRPTSAPTSGATAATAW